MPVENSKISLLTEKLYNTINAASEFVVAYADNNFKIKLSEIAKYILGVVGGVSRAIGTNDPGALVTRDGGQSQVSPSLSLPKINSVGVVSATSREIDYAAVGATSNLQGQINAIDSRVTQNEIDVSDVVEAISQIPHRYTYTVGIGAGSTTQVITAEAILAALAALGIAGASPKIDHLKVIAMFYDVGESMDMQSSTNIRLITQDIGSPAVTCLHSISFTVTSGRIYQYVIMFELIQ